jgi:hypothetical protein
VSAGGPASDDDLDDLVRVRRGAHRARSNPVAALVPAVLVVLAVLAVGIGTYALLSGGPGTAVVETSEPTGEPFETPVPLESGEPTPGAVPTATATTAPAPTTTAPPPEPTTTAPPPPVADRTVPVTVLNSTRTAGLAASAAGALENAGWRVAGTGNHRGSTPPTTVYFAAPVEQVTAEAVAADLGGARVQQSSSFDEPLTVVLGSDYSG